VEDVSESEALDREKDLPEYELDAEMLEMLVQFG
jgi:hypothetical protein